MRNLSGLIALAILASAAGCASDTDQPTSSANIGSNGAFVPDLSPSNPLASIEQNIAKLAGTCVIASAAKTMTITIAAAGEAVIISKRPVDSMVVVNGNHCTKDATGIEYPILAKDLVSITVTGSAKDDVVILDYSNGLFAAKTATAGGVVVNMAAADTEDTLAIKGTTGIDVVNYAQLTASPLAGSGFVSFTPTGTKLQDVTFSGVETHIASLGAGADNFTLAPFTGVTETLEFFGGIGDDTVNEGAAATPGETIHGGDGLDTVTYALRTAATALDATCITLDGAANDGACSFVPDPGTDAVLGTDDDTRTDTVTENDNIGTDVETVIGGAGDDVMTVPAVVTFASDGTTAVTHKLFGGAGSDRLYGGLGVDYLDGGADNDFLYDNNTLTNGADTYIGGDGIDLMDYHTRVGALTIIMGGTAASGAMVALVSEGDKVDATVENLISGDGDDTLTGNTLDNVIDGGPGADIINGLTGTDTVDYHKRTTPVLVNLTLRTAINGATSDTSATKLDTLAVDIENVIGSATAANTITGNSGDNEITGGVVLDTITGGLGNDIIDAGGGTTIADSINCGDDMDMVVNISGSGAINANCEIQR